MRPASTLPLLLAVSVVSCTHAPRVPPSQGSGPGARCVALPRSRPPPDACYLGTPYVPVPREPVARAAGVQVAPGAPEGSVAWPRCTPGASPGGTGVAPATVRYVGHLDLPDEAWAHGLSGLAWDGRGASFHAVQDNSVTVAGERRGPYVVHLTADDSLLHWTGALRTDLAVAPFDHLEAIAPRSGGARGGFFVSTDGDTSEGGSQELAHVASLAPGEAPRVAFALPPELRVPSHNSGIESMALTPDGRWVLLAPERPRHPEAGCESFVRIARIPLEGGGTPEVYAYPLTFDGAGVDVGLSEMAALADHTVLTLERSFTPGVGNSVRIYVTDLVAPPAPNPSGAMGGVHKSLLFDFAALPREDFHVDPRSGQCDHPALGNYEGMALGPCLSDGSRALVLTTDDNWDRDPARVQVRRVLVLALGW